MLLPLGLVFTLISLINALPEEENVQDLTNRLIDNINNDPNSTWKAGHNFHPNTPTSYLTRLLGVRLHDNSVSELEVLEDNEDYERKIKIPKYFDSRKKWKKCKSLREIRDQGNCGSCWAVAVASAFADRLCIASKAKWNKHISVRDLLSCCSYCGYGCKGGFPDSAWVYTKRRGLVTGGDYNSNDGCQPYPISPCQHHTEGPRPNCSALETESTPTCETTCTHGQSLSYESDHHKAKSAYLVPRNEKKIQLEIMKNGPVVAAFSVYSDFFLYKSGVYKHTPDSLYRGGHAVKVIGWGEEKGHPYWLVQNSWNYDWGTQGLFKIYRGINECGFESTMTAGLASWRK